MNISRQQAEFVAALQKKASLDIDYWSYKKMRQRPGLHGIIRYPAMMVPQMLADVLDAATHALPNLQNIFDPFVGSGTVMLESLRRGFEFDGVDINPLAILVCRAKLLALAPETVKSRSYALLANIHDDRSRTISINFPGRDKWFTRQACIELSRIRKAIVNQKNKSFRLFLWSILAETIRQTSLSRESTYKLHIRPISEHLEVEFPVSCFQRLTLNAIERYDYEVSSTSNLSFRKEAQQKIRLHCRDIRNISTRNIRQSQLIITSPPYGDNRSTITYGQFSYLALRWIAEEDLEGNLDLCKSAYVIDSSSLGGSSRLHWTRLNSALAASESFELFFKTLQNQERRDLEAKSASFTADLFDAIGAALSCLEPGGIAVWVLGERRIGGLPVPLVKICSEINEYYGLEPVTEIKRRIQSKRMPHRNSQGATMANETILVMQKRNTSLSANN